ncbi:helix-turn-helix domain-containing protein [Candidatus Gottesmanbacteria bacterium]|nr:helix-turn-helix domain-containing protein [Candidatus Gottesmanbacteria bacterium]
MRTVGQVLRDERLRKGFTTNQVEKATKIRAKFITRLEADDYQNLPAAPYIQGFIKNYSDFLGLRNQTMLALFRRQFTQKEKFKGNQIEEPITQSSWQITPNKVILGIVIAVITAFALYFYYQYQALHTPPPLLVESPKGDEVVSVETFPVYGKTDSDATITINNEPILVKEDGKFYKDMPVHPGSNTFVVKSRSRVGEETVVTRRVTRTP